MIIRINGDATIEYLSVLRDNVHKYAKGDLLWWEDKYAVVEALTFDKLHVEQPCFGGLVKKSIEMSNLKDITPFKTSPRGSYVDMMALKVLNYFQSHGKMLDILNIQINKFQHMEFTLVVNKDN